MGQQKFNVALSMEEIEYITSALSNALTRNEVRKIYEERFRKLFDKFLVVRSKTYLYTKTIAKAKNELANAGVTVRVRVKRKEPLAEKQ